MLFTIDCGNSADYKKIHEEHLKLNMAMKKAENKAEEARKQAVSINAKEFDVCLFH